MKLFNKKGFTIIEMLVVLSVFFILVSISVPFFKNFSKDIALNNDSLEIVSALRMAQNRSINSMGLHKHGVYFDKINAKYILTEYKLGLPIKEMTYYLKKGVDIKNDKTVVFERLTGERDTTTDPLVVLESYGVEKSINIDESGNIYIN